MRQISRLACLVPLLCKGRVNSRCIANDLVLMRSLAIFKLIRQNLCYYKF